MLRVTRTGLLLAATLFGASLSADEPLSGLPARTALDDYVAKEDPSYAWRLVKTVPGEGHTAYLLHMTSQTWRRPSEVDRTLWEHSLSVVKPDKVRTDKALLFIGGGSNRRQEPYPPDGKVVGIAMATRAVVAELRMVPNQPLAFIDDGRPRKEDDLIAHTWNKYMETGDPTWVARMPMVKSAVRAMDTVQALMARDDAGALPIREFVVAGGSKRGWTTWLTGAVDKRVVAIIPIVIDILNVIPSMEHHHAAYGFWAPAIGDYVRNGITDKKEAPEYKKLIRLVDPYFYRHRLRMPKFLINASGDQFFLPDSSQFYFDDLLGEKYLRYVPNADHGLRGSDALQSLQAYFESIVTATARPQFTWTFEKDGAIRVKTKQRPQKARLWQASNAAARDFRLMTIGKAWTGADLEDEGGGVYRGAVETPEKGWRAFFVELTFDSGGRNPWKFTTAVRVVPDTLPHLPEE